MRGWGEEDFFSSYRARGVGLSLQTVLPSGLAKEHGISQTEFLDDEMPTVKPVPGCKPSHEVEPRHKDYQWGRGLKGKEVIHW